MIRSVATIDAPEFINLRPMDISPMISECDIKVLYVGKNRNLSYISKDVAAEMAKTLRGNPIVGYYKEDKQDFADHGHKVIIDDEGIKFECLTVPYGFVAPDAPIWFQKFIDECDGEQIEHEYLMTKGYLWTGQFAEANQAFIEGKGQSMELDDETLDGYWQKFSDGKEFFIINDALFSKLCILGDNVEPCFEGAEISSSQSNYCQSTDKFTHTLFSMIQELKTALEGGKVMSDVTNEMALNESSTEEQVQADTSNNFEAVQVEDPVATEEVSIETMEPTDEPAKEVTESAEELPQEVVEEVNNTAEQLSKLQEEFSKLNTAYTELEAKCNQVTSAFEEYKKTVESAEKDKLIEKFNLVLSEEEKADIINNKDKYTYDEIESKLSIIYTRKNLQAAEEEKVEVEQEQNVVSYTLNDNMHTTVPAFVSALREQKNKNF